MSFRQYGILTKTFLRISLRINHWNVRNEGKQFLKLGSFTGPITFLFMGMMFISLVIHAKNQAGAALGMQYMGFAIICMTTLTLHGSLLFPPADVAVLFPRPVRPGAYIAARVTTLLAYISLVTLCMHLPGALLNSLTHGSGFYLLPHLCGAIVGSCSALLLCITALLVLLRLFNHKRLSNVIMYAEILLLVVIVASTQGKWFLSTDIGSILQSTVSHSSVYFLPPAWAYATAEIVAGNATPNLVAIARTGFLVILALAVFLVAVLGPQYKSTVQALSETPKGSEKNKRISHGLTWSLGAKILGSSLPAKAGFLFAGSTIKRSPDYRRRAIPGLCLPFIFMILGLFSNKLSWATSMSTISLLALASTSPFFALLCSKDYQAAWIFESAPLRGPGEVLRGAAIAITVKLILPTCILLGILGFWAFPPLEAICTLPLYLAAGLISLLIILRQAPLFPASIQMGESNYSGCGPMALAMLCASLLAGLHTLLVIFVSPLASLLISLPILALCLRGFMTPITKELDVADHRRRGIPLTSVGRSPTGPRAPGGGSF